MASDRTLEEPAVTVPNPNRKAERLARLSQEF
jgi:hypothetical protein